MSLHDGFNRRHFLLASVSTLAFLATPALATVAEVEAALKKALGDGVTAKTDPRIKINVPEVAENGATVPVTVSVDSPMTDKDHVKQIILYAEENPFPDVASYKLSPLLGKAEISTKIRMGKSQGVRAVAQLSDGSVIMARAEIKVTVGGCG
jgi:sulfur-oxidizing protein SoxY